MENHKFTIPDQANQGIIVYEYGIRLDKESKPLVWQQIQLSRKLYNNIVASMRQTFDAMNTFILERAGDEGKQLNQAIEEGIERFKTAKAEQNEDDIKETVLFLREKRAKLSEQLKGVRTQYKEETKRNFFNRIGMRTSCETYQIRSQAVKDGLGWATANEVLNSALKAFQARIKTGQPPKFAVGEEKQQDSLRTQFTQAGGCPVATLFESEHSGLSLRAAAGFGRRKYGTFRFRLGEAKSDVWATGTCQFHREIPSGATVASAALVQRRIGRDLKHALQLVVKLPQQAEAQATQSKKFCTVHFGWASEEGIQYVMALADQENPTKAQLFQLPTDIETDFNRVENLASQRSKLLNDLVLQIKSGSIVIPSQIKEVADEFDAIKRLPATHISLTRLHRICRLMIESDIFRPEALERWRRQDRLLLQDIAHIRRRALYRRRDFYRVTASVIAKSYGAIVIETLDLKKANTKINMVTGEKSDKNKKSRSRQRMAALHELQRQLRQAAGKAGCVIIELTGEKTTATCAFCNREGTTTTSESSQVLHCPHCGSQMNRKQNGAAVAWQLASPIIDDLVHEARSLAAVQSSERAASKILKAEKVATARKANRAAREPAATDK